MTALAVHAPHSPQLSWPRIGAWSGTLSLHLIILVLFLAPSAAILIVHQQEMVVPIVDLIQKQMPLPAEPVPPTITHPTPVVHHPLPPVVSERHEPVTPTRAELGEDSPSPPPTVAGPAAGEDVAPSAITYGSQPRRVAYPRESLLAREQGTVVLRVLVGADGAVEKVEIEKSSGHARLDHAARDAVRAWLFNPAKRSGIAHEAWALVPVTFSLSQL